ncbi:acyltransferase [Winogradskyella sp. PE311]|uniref:acyltransferase n=1 Tax=Winogradskyella sp. PE311 TaxID=3366943 RepID=UPI003980A6EC
MPIINGRLFVKNKGTINIGKGVKFNSSLTSNYVGLQKPCTICVSENGNLKIGDFSGFSGVSLFCSMQIKIGDYVNFGGNVFIWDTDFHPIDYELRREGFDGVKSSPISIGNDVFIGANSTILKGVTIGEKSIVGAGSLVTKDIPANEMWAGNPARLIKKI